MHSYDYSHRHGIELISWERFAELSRDLAMRLSAHGVAVVVGVARSGLFPATAVACALRCEFFPVRVSRREGDEVRHSHPVWRVPVTDQVKGKCVAVIDEIADTGETLDMVRQQVTARGASSVVTAALVGHSWAQPAPDITALRTDALVVFPWNREVIIDGAWVPNPELEKALRLQSQK
jgi:hypoxanthine phosphoribosyltransferase